MAPKAFEYIFAQPELNRHVGSFLGDDREGLLDQTRWCMTARPLAGPDRVRLWCLGCLWRWLNMHMLQPRAPIGYAAVELPWGTVTATEDFPHGW